MRKILLSIFCMAVTVAGFAQQSFLRTYEFEFNYDEVSITITGVKSDVVLSGDISIPGSFTDPDSGTRYVVTAIGYSTEEYGPLRGAFYGQSEITSVYIPSTIESISYGAFTGCKKIKEFKVSSESKNYTAIDGALYEKDSRDGTLSLLRFPPARTSTGFTLPEEALYIESEAFADNYTITKLRLSKFQQLFDQALKGNLGITTFELNDSYVYTTDGHFLFTDETRFSHLKGCGTVLMAVAPKYCMNTALSIPSNVQTISSVAGSRASTVIIPSTVTEIFGTAFAGCSFETVTIPATVKKLSSFYLFYDCRLLKSVKIDAKMSEAKEYMFADCTSLSSVSLPSSCKTLGEGCFAGCKSLTSFPGLYNFPNLDPAGGQFAGSGLTSVNIPTSWTTIPDCMFYDCRDLKTVNLNDGVTKICREAFGNTGLEMINTRNVNKMECHAIRPLYDTMRKIVIPEHEGTMELDFYSFSVWSDDIDLYIDQKSMGDYHWPYGFYWKWVDYVRMFTSKRSFGHFFTSWKELYVPAGSASHYRSLTNDANAAENVYEMFSMRDVDAGTASLTVVPNFPWVKITGVTINDQPATNTANNWAADTAGGNLMNVKIAYTANDIKFTTEYNLTLSEIEAITGQSGYSRKARKIVWHAASARPGARYVNLMGQPCTPVEGQTCIELPGDR